MVVVYGMIGGGGWNLRGTWGEGDLLVEERNVPDAWKWPESRKWAGISY
jgi:hypothetical protein